MSESYAVCTNNLTKKFGNIIAVNKLSVNIPYGKTYGLLGPNGAGKTTTVRILNGIIPCTNGSALINGFDLNTQVQKIKEITGFLPESPGIYQKLTAKEFLEFIGELYYLPKEILNNRIDELLDLFNLKDRKNDLLEGYSRGMKQKICLCAALIQDPEIIFLDEPTSNLDPSASRMVKDLISELSQKADKTIIICTHLLDAAEELCDIIGIIDKGVLKIEGSPNEIIESVDAENLEEAYLKITGSTETGDMLSWRDGVYNKGVVTSDSLVNRDKPKRKWFQK